MKSYLMKEKDPFILRSPHCDCGSSGDARNKFKRKEQF